MYNVGIDWADKKHDITIVDHTGEIIVQNFTVKNNLAGFEKLLDKLRAVSTAAGDFKIGIETPHHLVVDFLIDQDYLAHDNYSLWLVNTRLVRILVFLLTSASIRKKGYYFFAVVN